MIVKTFSLCMASMRRKLNLKIRKIDQVRAQYTALSYYTTYNLQCNCTYIVRSP